MFQHPLFIIQLSVLALVAFLHGAGVYGSLYWHWWWFDLVTHGLGGLWVVLAALWFTHFSDLAPAWLRGQSMVLVAATALVGVGLAWEVFEIFIQAPRESAYYVDTAIDLVMDAFGGALGFWFVRTHYDHT